PTAVVLLSAGGKPSTNNNSSRTIVPNPPMIPGGVGGRGDELEGIRVKSAQILSPNHSKRWFEQLPWRCRRGRDRRPAKVRSGRGRIGGRCLRWLPRREPMRRDSRNGENFVQDTSNLGRTKTCCVSGRRRP